jgi:hypothetical protein
MIKCLANTLDYQQYESEIRKHFDNYFQADDRN